MTNQGNCMGVTCITYMDLHTTGLLKVIDFNVTCICQCEMMVFTNSSLKIDAWLHSNMSEFHE